MIVRETKLETDYCECPSGTLILCHNKSARGVYSQRATIVANLLMVEGDWLLANKGMNAIKGFVNQACIRKDQEVLLK